MSLRSNAARAAVRNKIRVEKQALKKKELLQLLRKAKVKQDLAHRRLKVFGVTSNLLAQHRADLGLGKKVLWRLYSCGKLVLGLPRSRITKGWVDTFYQSATLRLRMAWNASVGLPRQHGVSDLPFGYICFFL